MAMCRPWGTRPGFGCPTAERLQTGSPTLFAAAIRCAAATASGDVTQVVVPGFVPVAVGAGVLGIVGDGVRAGRGVAAGGLGSVVAGDREGWGRAGAGEDGGLGSLGDVGEVRGGVDVGEVPGGMDAGDVCGGVAAGEVCGGVELGGVGDVGRVVGVRDGFGGGVWGGGGLAVGVWTGGGGGRGVRWGDGRVPGGTGGRGWGGLGAGVCAGPGVVEAGVREAGGRVDGDWDGLGVGGVVVTDGDSDTDGCSDGSAVTDGDDVGCDEPPPLPEDTRAQAPRPAPTATTAAPPAIHGARRGGCRCRFMVLTVYPIVDRLKPRAQPPPAGSGATAHLRQQQPEVGSGP